MPAPLHPDFLRLPIAHRALHDRAAGRPENSRAAIRAAVQAGYGIEIDLQPSAEGVPMVFHDYDLNRLTGQPGPIRTRSAADLAALPLLGGDEGIPTFAEVLALVAGQVPLLVEIKDQDGAMGPGTGGFEARVAEVLAGYTGPLAVMSFNPHAVTAFAAAAPGVAVGLTTSAYDPADWAPLPVQVCDRLREIPDYTSSSASFISHEHGDLARPRVAELKTQGAAILCWTIRSPEAEAAARQHAQNITFEGYAAPIPA
ncbi:glycerophosphodiester phosphodiesterase family protein [Frigidibacter mobilis]|uniref:Glycerophosphoryl diester phosphodiesterase n=1 Tax=Frigidibacter mobilis TaxID=1335048 RepID=A0A165ST46_9RHOB|nr:glycerophosphodiester phosphodiesterase family protein [Frigidibacter mobilis]AMY70793.1 glycerophosphoryl diester phosphodiesterase [Frigidibacter mobilis]